MLYNDVEFILIESAHSPERCAFDLWADVDV